MFQAKSPRENVLWHLSQCSKDTNLDRDDRLPRARHFETALSPGTQPVQGFTLFGGQSLRTGTANLHISTQCTRLFRAAT